MGATQTERSHITTHVLDTGTGKPASGVTATLEAKTASGWREIGSGVTDQRRPDPAPRPGTG